MKYYPYCLENPEHFYKNLPVDYESCLLQFDTILKPEVINYFRSRDSAIASIEFAQEIGGLFVNFWNMDYYRLWQLYEQGNDQSWVTSKLQLEFKRNQIAPAAKMFHKMGIDDPEAMIRILLSCYHKKLNNRYYNWDEEIANLKSYWVVSKTVEGWVGKEMRKREYEILALYHFNSLQQNDTVKVHYSRNTTSFSRKKPNWFVYTGIIQSKNPEDKIINVQLIDILTATGDKFVVEDKDTTRIGDTFSDYSWDWRKLGLNDNFWWNTRMNPNTIQ